MKTDRRGFLRGMLGAAAAAPLAEPLANEAKAAAKSLLPPAALEPPAMEVGEPFKTAPGERVGYCVVSACSETISPMRMRLET